MRFEGRQLSSQSAAAEYPGTKALYMHIQQRPVCHRGG